MPIIAVSATVGGWECMDKLEAIRYFLKLGETLSFKGTAAHFGVQPSKVSRSIQSLEAELGVSLVERTTRNVRFTETGIWYRGEVSEPLRALGAADEFVAAQAKDPVGTLRITALTSYGEIRLCALLEQFRKAYPRIICDVELTDRYLDLSTGEIDIAIRATAEPPDYLVAKPLHSHRFVLVASPSYIQEHGRPVTLADVGDHAALGYRGPMGAYPWQAVSANGEFVTVSRRLALITNHGSMMLKAAIAGEGLAFLPLWGIESALAQGTLEEIHLQDAHFVKSVGADAKMYLLYHPSKARLGKVRAMVDFLTQTLAVS